MPKTRLRFNDLTGRRRSRCLRMLRAVLRDGETYVRHESEFRNARRLHDSGLVTAAASRPSWRRDRYPFRELALFADEAEARRRYPWTIMPRRRKR